MTAPDWKNPDNIAIVAKMRADDVKYHVIGKHFGVSKNAIAGVVARYITVTDARYGDAPRPAPVPQLKVNSTWTDKRLTEPWVKFSARRKAERAKARQMELAA